MQAHQIIDPDLALWDKARDLLADELGIGAHEVMDSGARMYVENHAPAYAAMLIAEDEELEALYDEAHRRLDLAAANAMSPAVDDAGRRMIALAAPIVVHAALEARS
jgi:hypothetical protein